MSQAPGPKIDDFELLAGWIYAQDIFWLQVAVDHSPFFQEDERLEKLRRV